MANINNKIVSLTFTEQNAPEVLGVANELAELEDRKPHDSAKRLILEAGKAKIVELKKELNIPANADSLREAINITQPTQESQAESESQ